LWYLSPVFFLSRFTLQPLHLRPWSTPAWLNTTFRVRASGIGRPLLKQWGRALGKTYSWAEKTEEKDVTGEIEKFRVLTEEISKLLEVSFPLQLIVGTHTNNDEEFNPEAWASIPHIKAIREALPRIAPALKRRKIYSLYFRFWTKETGVYEQGGVVYFTGV